MGAENESAAFRQQTQSRTYPRLCRFGGRKNLCESREYGEMTIVQRRSVCRGARSRELAEKWAFWRLVIRPDRRIKLDLDG
jgi:hypothetical protein